MKLHPLRLPKSDRASIRNARHTWRAMAVTPLKPLMRAQWGAYLLFTGQPLDAMMTLAGLVMRSP
jgi:hypothetical protein